MAKAYDRVQWPFLIKVLKRMGFPEGWLRLIDRCIGSCWFSILINGVPSGFFKSTRGLRQGDPISPALFVIAADYLSRALDSLILGKKEMLFKSSRYSTEVSHLAYADDILIFTQAATSSIRNLRHCLDKYAAISGQQINLNKSSFYIDELHEDWSNSIQEEGGYARGTFPFLYLGVPIFRGAKRTDMFLFLRDKIAKRINGWAHRHLSFGGRLILIKSTLEAIPLHIFQAIEPTTGIIKQLEQQLARFFWGAANDRKRTHWISWEQICLPTAEGGLGIRRFLEVMRAFSVKLWWRFREQNSLWATYMFRKYCYKTSPLTISISGRSSPIWRRLSRAWGQAHPHIRWVIGDGSILFWDDIWLGESALRELCLDDRGDRLARVSDFWYEGQWCTTKLQMLHTQAGLPQAVIEDIKNIPILSGEKDNPRWNLSRHGNFSLASAWEINRSKRPIVPALEDIWNAGLTLSMSIFIWRLLSNRVPVDAKLQWRNISLASKCQCCFSKPGTESLQHLFIQGQGASEVWREFDTWFDGPHERLRSSDSIPDRLEIWARRSQQPAKGHLSRLIPCLILWFLWAERHNCRHNEARFRPHNVIWQVQMHIRNLAINGSLSPKHWRGCAPRAAIPGHSGARRVSARVTPIKWNPPDPPWIKLNTDGSYSASTGHAAGGGLVRDHNGKLLGAFAIPLTARSAFEAELLAIYHGLMLAKELGRLIWVESDASQAVSLLTSGKLGPADTRHAMARIIRLQKELRPRFTFIPREGNMAADYLAKMGMEASGPRLFDEQSAPNLLKAMIQLDRIGLPNLRREEEAPT